LLKKAARTTPLEATWLSAASESLQGPRKSDIMNALRNSPEAFEEPVMEKEITDRSEAIRKRILQLRDSL
jgi:hypothetical protein